MEHPGFFEKSGPFPLSEVAAGCEAELAEGFDPSIMVSDVRPLDSADSNVISFLDNKKYVEQLETTSAAACFVAPKFLEKVPSGTVPMIAPAPYRSFAKALALFYPEAMRSKSAGFGIDEFSGFVHPSAQIEDGVIIEPGAVIGREAHIGRGSQICAGAVVGYRCMVGRDCYIGPSASVTHSLIGNNVIIHAGVRLGQDGFGFAMGPSGHLKVPQIGRVIVQDDVEIGAETAVDRGALDDTIIGEGTKIDNQVQIAHNVVVGRHCVLVAKCGIAGSTELGDFAVMGGGSRIAGHLKMGPGAMLAGGSMSKDDIPAGGRWGGWPAKPFMEWARELSAIKRLGQRKPSKD